MLIQLCIAEGLAASISAICRILEAVLYSVPNSYLEILQKRGTSFAPVIKELKSAIHRPITATFMTFPEILPKTIGVAYCRELSPKTLKYPDQQNSTARWYPKFNLTLVIL